MNIYWNTAGVEMSLQKHWRYVRLARNILIIFILESKQDEHYVRNWYKHCTTIKKIVYIYIRRQILINNMISQIGNYKTKTNDRQLGQMATFIA